jgi:hypothetical protein
MRKYYLLLIILFLLPINSVSGLYEGYATNKELQLRFNEQDSGTGHTYDSSVNNHSITETWKYTDGFTTPSYNAEADSCARFINDSTLLIPEHTTLQPVSEPFHFTLGFWIKILSPPQDNDIYIIRQRDVYEVYLANNSATSYEMKFQFFAANYESSYYSYSTTLINLNQWYFVVFSTNTTGFKNIYINTVLDHSDSMGGNPVESDATRDFAIHVSFDNYSSDVLIDDVFFYLNSTFSQDYIDWLYENMPYMDSSEIPEETTTTTTTTEEEGFPAGREGYQIIIGDQGFSVIEVSLIMVFIATGSILGYMTIGSLRKGKR